MSFFAGHDVNAIPDNPNELPDNTYHFRVTSAKFGPTQSGDKQGITFKYQIVEGAWSNFFPLTDWVQIPDGNTPQDKVARMLSYLKMRLLAFGFSPEEIQNFGPDDVEKCVNREFYGTTSTSVNNNRKQFRVAKFDPLVSDPSDPFGDLM